MKTNRKAKHQRQSLQIIAGTYRHRKIHFIEADGLRPTSCRIRETLFNWLQADIYGKTCLDLFAGSGALGFEALSRGAKHVTFVEKNRQVAKQLQENIQQLNIDNASVINRSFEQALSGQYDVIFLDPPYTLRLLPSLLEQIKTLSPKLIFIEDNQRFDEWITDTDSYKILKSKKAGSIYYGLLKPI